MESIVAVIVFIGVIFLTISICTKHMEEEIKKALGKQKEEFEAEKKLWQKQNPDQAYLHTLETIMD